MQLRPTAQRSLCEWHDAQSATDTAAAPSSDEEEVLENEAAQHTSNAAELGRMMFN